MLPVSVLLSFLAAPIFVLADADLPTKFNLYHRYLDPAAPQPAPFAPRGVIRVAPSPLLEQQTDAGGVSLPELDLHSPTVADVLYQVAIERPGDKHEAHWDISSAKACHLPLSTAETVVLHLAANGEPFALDYFLANVPHDGACPRPKRKSKSSGTAFDISTHPIFSGAANASTVLLRTPHLPPLPELRTPPPLSPEGAPVQPVPEKSFVQKYWIYIVLVLGAFLLTGGGEEEPARAGSS
ncbi:hypothetical protein PLICRDRAFT_149099 [Plicaturopsis crispa FD-325 SS-3]|nr:hypothetical protein PLICRDRAFT_149099 [Plicaturopsis crispa FD-325 SS-3]